MTKTVCIVGAGPSGLVAAKTLLHDVAPGTFKVTIFDAQPCIGGLWPSSKTDDGAGLVHPLMVANQSRHTVQFSDLAWNETAPHIPRAWQVGRYLERYAKTYTNGADIKLGCKIVKTELQPEGGWTVETESKSGTSLQKQSSVFDHLLVATGFFGKPILADYVPASAQIPVIHSSKYRDLVSLLGRENGKGGDILVVGGQMSGIEIAGTIATHLSSAVNSPGEKLIPNPDKYTVHHVAPRPAWVFPLFTSPRPDSSAPPFLPCDLGSYNLAARPRPLKNTQGHISVEAARTLNSIYQSALGTDQSGFSERLKLDGELLGQQPYLAMSSYYADFVRNGLIKVSPGKISSISGTSAVVTPSNEQIHDIAAIVFATGFDSAPSIDFLPPSVKDQISYDPAHVNMPAALAFHGTHHPAIPSLGFVGFYRSPYWGVMEMQARLIAYLWTTPEESRSEACKTAVESDDTIARTLQLRMDPRVSQFPMGDYPFLMQDFAQALSLIISPARETPPLANGESMDILTPARYASHGVSERQCQEIRKSLTDTHKTAVEGLSQGRFVAQAVFRSLLGEWRLERDLVSRLPSHPSGRFSGIAKFLLREGTADGREAKFAAAASSTNGDGLGDIGLEYLYIEDGNFTATGVGSAAFRATRRYMWRYDEAEDKLSVWFARTDDAARADYLFHVLEFNETSGCASDKKKTEVIEGEETNTQGDEAGWKACASHLCIEDLYNVRYEFKFQAVNLKEWTVSYDVKGPKKDYSIKGTYTRL